MYRIILNHIKNKYEYEELIKLFLKPSEYRLFGQDELNISNFSKDDIVIEIPEILTNTKDENPKNQLKRTIFDELKKHTGLTPDWGILTGVRPVKLTGELLSKEGTIKKVRSTLIDNYFLNPEKADMLLELYENQERVIRPSPTNEVGIYIGIPFCPTRCLYCSFTSNQGNEVQIKTYLEALHKEIDYVAAQMKGKEWCPETIYVGGGTPTTISAEALKELLFKVNDSFNLSKLKEFTLEAGRPDTITREKLQVIKEGCVDRISINPQSMKAHTLELIGRSHKPEDIIEAFGMAKDVGIPFINADVIAGLPDEDEEDFAQTLRTLINLEPQNITVHTLALKRASRLKEIDSDYNYRQGRKVKEMLSISRDLLSKSDYHPYYLYRQKQMIGNFENVGYAKPNTDGIYNMRIMEERQTIIALGAGGISKVYFPEENRLERVANVSNYQIYVERLDEMLKRKEDNLGG